MKILQKIALLLGCLTIILGVIGRLFLPEKILFGLGAITYLRLTIAMLLFSIAFYFGHKE